VSPAIKFSLAYIAVQPSSALLASTCYISHILQVILVLSLFQQTSVNVLPTSIAV